MARYTLNSKDKDIQKMLAKLGKDKGLKISEWTQSLLKGDRVNEFAYIEISDEVMGFGNYYIGGSDELLNPIDIHIFVDKILALVAPKPTDVSFSNGQTGQVFMDRIIVGCTTVMNKELDELIKARDELTNTKPRSYYATFEHNPFRGVIINGILTKYHYTCKVPAFEVHGEIMLFDLNEKTITILNYTPTGVPNVSIGDIITAIDKDNNPSYRIKSVKINNNKVISVTPTEVIHEGYTFSHAEVRQVKQIMDRLNKKS